MKESVMANLERGVHQPGDLIPWTVSQQFADYEFAGLSGARIVRIATHPDYQKVWVRGGQTTASLGERNADIVYRWVTDQEHYSC